MREDSEKVFQGPKDEGPRFLESKPAHSKKQQAAQKKQWVILSVLIVLLIVVSVQTLARGKKKPRAVKPAVAAAVVAAPGPVAATPENDAFQAAGYEGQDRQSPFMKITEEEEAVIAVKKRLVLQGVLSDSKGDAYAVINEKIVKKGERMADKVVTSIRSDSVTLLTDDGEEETLRMKT